MVVFLGSDNSEKSSKYFSDLLIGKSIVLFNQRDDKILNSKNPKNEKQKFKRNVSTSNKKIKISKISIKKLNLSDVYILNNLWIKYINNFFKNKKLEDKNSSKLQNLELIGAVVCILQACNKNLVSRKGVIVNRSRNCYLIAECNDDFLDPKNNWKCKVKPENGSLLLCHLFTVVKSEIHIGVYYPPVNRDSAILEDRQDLFILYGQKCSNIL